LCCTFEPTIDLCDRFEEKIQEKNNLILKKEEIIVPDTT
jgi:hypothetical protein